MSYSAYTKETNKPFQTFYNDPKIVKIKNRDATAIDEGRDNENEEDLRAAKAIISALIF